MSKDLTMKQLKKIIKECTQAAMAGDLHPPSTKAIEIVLPRPEEISAGLFPGMKSSSSAPAAMPDMNVLDISSVAPSLVGGQQSGEEKGMIAGNLAMIADKAAELKQLAAQVPDNEEWVQEKIAVAASMIDSIYNYLKYNKEQLP